MTVVLPHQPSAFLDRLAEEHRAWLSTFNPQYRRNWEKLLKDNDEAAMTEAGIRRFLVSNGCAVEPNEDLTGVQQRPDFRCQTCERRFYVEVTCISLEKATEITGLANGANAAMRPSPLNSRVYSICQKKAVQCSNHDAPVLVAVGTFHSVACMFSFSPPYVDMLLAGTTTMTVNIDRRTLHSVGGIEQQSELASAAFLRPDDNEAIGFARSSISGLLLCGISLEPMWVVGVLHPNPARRFDPTLLPKVSFREVEVLHESGQVRIRSSEGNMK